MKFYEQINYKDSEKGTELFPESKAHTFQPLSRFKSKDMCHCPQEYPILLQEPK